MHLLLTGATGLVGQYLVRDLLRQGASLAVLIRAQGDTSARQRLEQILSRWEGELGEPLPRPVCLEGDINRDGLGLGGEDRAWAARHCGAVLHNAASLTFVGKDRDKEPWLSNLRGTENVLDFCRRAGLRQLHYVSTAYVCGKRTGTVYEDELDLGQDFRNDYENSKLEAEKRVRGAEFLDSLTVYRPAVIVGDSRTGYTSTYHGLYTYLRFVWLFLQYLDPGPDGRYDCTMRLNLTGGERRNLVPVDWVSAVTARLVRSPEHHGRTYHLTPTHPVTAARLQEAMARYFNFYGPVFAGPDALASGKRNVLEEMFYAYVDRYEPYWSLEPVFDCANTLAAAPHLPCPEIDEPCLRRLIDFGVRDQWGKGGGQAEAS